MIGGVSASVSSAVGPFVENLEIALSKDGAYVNVGLGLGVMSGAVVTCENIKGQPVEETVARASTPEIVSGLAEVTEQAMSIGVFGSPSFVVGDEVFWGDDRLDDAISWSRTGRAEP